MPVPDTAPRRILILDDLRSYAEVRARGKILPKGPYSLVRSRQEFVDWVEKNGIPDFVSFDIDLLPEHYLDLATPHPEDGLACIDYLINAASKAGVDFPDYAIHSQNHIKTAAGHAKIEDYEYGRDTWLHHCHDIP